MAKVKYTGRSDRRVLDADDLKKLGVEGFRKTTFNRHESVEVDEAVAEVLTEHKALKREFSIVEDEEDNGQGELDFEAAIETPQETKEAELKGGQSAGSVDAGTTSTGSTTPATDTGGATGGTRRAGRGSSTRAR